MLNEWLFRNKNGANYLPEKILNKYYIKEGCFWQ